MTKEVTVEVTITERVRYSAFVQMPLEKFNEMANDLEEMGGRELRMAEERIGNLCDRRNDWQDADDVEIEEFRIVSNQKGEEK